MNLSIGCRVVVSRFDYIGTCARASDHTRMQIRFNSSYPRADTLSLADIERLYGACATETDAQLPCHRAGAAPDDGGVVTVNHIANGVCPWERRSPTKTW